MRRFLKAAGEKGSFVPGVLSADIMSSVRNSSFSSRVVGSWMVCVFGGDLGEEKKLKRDVDAGVLEGVGSIVERVGRFRSLADCRSGLASREGEADMLVGDEGASFSDIGIPTATGAEEPENQDARPPLLLSSNFITPLRSPVSVGINSSSTVSLSIVFFLSGLLLFPRLLGTLNGNNAVNDRCVLVCLGAQLSSSAEIGTDRGKGRDDRAAAGGGVIASSPSTFSKLPPST